MPTKTPAKKKKPKYKVTLELYADKTVKAEGDTVNEALDNLGLNYTHIKTKGTLTLQKGKLKASRFFYLRPLRRVVANKLRKAQVSNELERLLK